VIIIGFLKEFFYVFLNRTFQTRLTYIRPGYILSFRLELKDSNVSFDLDDVNSFFCFD
jgi:hypothetical protein